MLNARLFLLAPLGRLLLALPFIVSAPGKLMAPVATAGYMASAGLPNSTSLAVAVGLFEIVAALSLIAGFKARWAALALALLPTLARAAGFDVEHATQAWLSTLSPAARLKSDAYSDGSQWIMLIGTVLSVLVCWIMLRLRLLPRVRDSMQRRGWRSTSARRSANPWSGAAPSS